VKLDCHIVKDLLPLYAEGLTGAESAKDIREHLAECPACQKELLELQSTDFPTPFVGEKPKGGSAFKKIMGRLHRELHTVFCVAIVFFLLFGFSLTAGSDVLFNVLIMPVAGVIAYLAFRWRAIYMLPLLLILTELAALLLRFVEMEPVEVLGWTLIYSLFALAGALVAFLLHFAFGKESML